LFAASPLEIQIISIFRHHNFVVQFALSEL